MPTGTTVTDIQQRPGLDAEDAQLEAWERLQEPALVALPFVMLVAAAVLSLVLSPSGPAEFIDLGIAGAAGAWILAFTLWRSWRGRTGPAAVFFVVLAVLMATLVVRSPIFGFFSFTGYFFALQLPRKGWRVAGVIVIAIITGTSQAGGLPKDTAGSLAFYAGIVAINIGVAGALIWFSFVDAEQNYRRRQAVDELSEANRRLEATLAENAGLHEQLLVQARQTGVYDERQRMAREIHDTLAQSLTGIITQLQAADQASRDTERRRHLDAALTLARDGLTEARRSVRALRPTPLEDGRIGEALNDVTRRWAALYGVSATVITTGSARPISQEAELTLLRTAQEALANVAKHARASRVGLTLSYMSDQVTLDIRDDGVGGIGSPPAAHGRSGDDGAGDHGAGDHGARPAGGFGLTAMRERVEGLAGTLAIESEPGVGTTISASLPLGCPGGSR
jgi:signal transduction histidine kinase